jgi:hypothetical protein
MRRDVSDFIPYLLAADSKNYFVLALQDVDNDGLPVIIGQKGLISTPRLPFLEVSLRLYAINYLKVPHSPPLQFTADAVVA